MSWRSGRSTPSETAGDGVVTTGELPNEEATGEAQRSENVVEPAGEAGPRSDAGGDATPESAESPVSPTDHEDESAGGEPPLGRKGPRRARTSGKHSSRARGRPVDRPRPATVDASIEESPVRTEVVLESGPEDLLRAEFAVYPAPTPEWDEEVDEDQGGGADFVFDAEPAADAQVGSENERREAAAATRDDVKSSAASGPAARFELGASALAALRTKADGAEVGSAEAASTREGSPTLHDVRQLGAGPSDGQTLDGDAGGASDESRSGRSFGGPSDAKLPALSLESIGETPVQPRVPTAVPASDPFEPVLGPGPSAVAQPPAPENSTSNLADPLEDVVETPPPPRSGVLDSDEAAAVAGNTDDFFVRPRPKSRRRR